MRSTYPAVFNLTDLNGQNGFIINGETGNICGASVSIAGNINKDPFNFNDLIIGTECYSYNTTTLGTGRTYVIFGSTNIAPSGLLSLSSLNGTNGYKIDGAAAYDASGSSASSVGDVYLSGQGNCDVLIGAYEHPGTNNVGRAYLVRGNALASAPGGVLSLSSLGASGFIFDGETAGDQLGWPYNGVSGAGDFNGDGLMDLLLGAPSHNNKTGRGYLVYGSSGVAGIPSGGTLALSNLNGVNGFKIDGENMGDSAAYAVTAAGDVNGDSYADLLLSAPYYNSSAPSTAVGRAYVIYGNSSRPPSDVLSGVFSLSSLNGTNGYKIDGEFAGFSYQRVWSISTAGDVNGDGLSDLLIGIYFAGRSYVIYGNRTGFPGGVLALSSLNGDNGFKINGENPGDESGLAVSTAGDFNGDNHSDLLISAGTRKGYVLFGGPTVGAGGIVNLSTLNGTNGFILNIKSGGILAFKMSGGQDINGDSLDDIVLGAQGDNPAAYVVFGDKSPQLITNQLSLQKGATVTLTSQNLDATDNQPVTFTITNVQYGHFELVSAPGPAITTFTQSQISNQQVQFVHHGSNFPPSYDVQMINTGIALSPPPQTVSFNATHNGPTKVQDIPAKLWVWTVGQQISIPLNDTFSDLDIGQTLIYDATLQTGQPLPDGLSITQSPPELGGLVTQPLQSTNILIKATDSVGLSANTSFTLQVQAAAPSPCSAPGMSHYQSSDVICKTVASLIIALPSTGVTVLLAGLGIWLRRRDIEKTWKEPRYAIHNLLRQELKLEIGRASDEQRYIDGIYKLIGAVLNIQLGERQRRDSDYSLQIGNEVKQMPEATQQRYATALVTAIRAHIVFPKLCCDDQRVSESKGVKLAMPIYRYFNGFIPNPIASLSTYEFKPDTLKAAFDDIVRTARSNLGEAVDDRPVSGSGTGLGSGAAFFPASGEKQTIELGQLVEHDNAYQI